MSLYIDYHRLSQSYQFDKIIYNSVVSAKWSLLLMFLVSGPISSFVPMTILFARTLIPDVYVRRILGWCVIIWTFFNGMILWTLLFLHLELIREFLRFGVPYLMTKLSTVLPEDPIAETATRRIFRILKSITQQHSMISIQQLILVGINYSQGDQSERFNDDEKRKLRKFFRDFSSTSFIYDPDTTSITIFFPSFIIRINSQGFQITSDDSLKIVRSESDEVCPVCRDKYADFSIELKCKHRYCHKCIFSWLNQQYTCPICRAVVV